MSKIINKFVCQSCGYVSPKWSGKCPNCDAWSSFVEELVSHNKKSSVAKNSKLKPISIKDVESENQSRLKTNINEFDRVLGGGIVSGSVILIGGDPGIGKSTLMLQMAAKIKDKTVLYVTGEESLKQIKLRAERLNILSSDIQLFAETNLEIVADVIENASPDIAIIDSIQTLYLPQLESSPGSIGQMREATTILTRLAKQKNISIFLIGHITKDGSIAGPKVVEHIVDTVLQFEGERHYSFRILRSLKNRFGSTNEIGIFEMREEGLCEVLNPSKIFLSERSLNSSGSAIVSTIEGTRPLLVEVQALVTPTSYGMPQRTVTGFDLRRLQMLLAVIEKRAGIRLGGHDVFVNVAGGIRIDEPAADLAVVLSIVSSFKDTPINSNLVTIGEVGLSGEIRNVSFIEKRIQEAIKLGFSEIIIPQGNSKLSLTNNCKLIIANSISDALKIF